MVNTKEYILFIDDDPIDRIAFKRFAVNGNFTYDFKIAGSVKESIELIQTENFKVIISDFNLGDGNALEIINCTDIPVIIITGLGDGKTAVKAMKAGAYDFLIKDNLGDYLQTLPISVDNAIKHKAHETELTEYREHLEEIVKERTLALEKEIEERKKTEQELILATEKAEESDRLKTAFLANMSHEIRTPMNAILGFASLLDNEDVTNSDRKSYVSIVQNNSKQLLRIITDIIDISKIESQQLKINNSKCNINSLIKFLYTQFNTQKEQENSEVSINYQLDLIDELSFIETDDVRLTQVLTNLISNALKFTKEGEINFGYSLSGKKHLLFYVKDTGIGIQADKIKIIFERFRQSEETNTRNYGGTGLGLSISKGLVNLLGGNIGVNSTMGLGSNFYFTIPYKKFKNKVDTSSFEEKKEKKDLNLEGKTFLIVDDREDVLKYIEVLLSSTKVNLIFSTNGIEAVSIFEKNKEKIELVLMDIQLPGIDGNEAIKRIRKISPEIPIIVQTAFAFAEDKDKYLKISNSEYITKPINRDLLFQKIKNLC